MAAALKEVQDLVQDEKNRVIEYKRLLEAQKHLSLADQTKIRQLEQKIEEQLDALGLGKAEYVKLEKDLTETRALLDEESKKVTELLHAGHNFDGARASSLLETEQNKVRALEHSCEQLMSLLDWEKKHTALEESQKKVLKLSYELESFEDMKNEILRLTLVARQRDVMIAAMLYAIGDAKAVRSEAPVQNAETYIDELESRVIGLDLAGLDADVLQDREARQLVTYDASARNRTLRNIVLPLVLAGGMVEYHNHDPTVLRELALTVGQMSGDLRTNFGEFSHTLGDLSSTIGANLSANMGQLASALKDSAALRATVAQVSSMASRRMNIREV
eukprot:jgi/Psemu1/242368/estExt_Genewise1.C_2820029